MTRALRFLLVAAVVALVAAGCSSGGSGGSGKSGKDASESSAPKRGDDPNKPVDTARDGSDTGKDTATPPDDAFPKAARPPNIKGVDDQPGDWGFFTGENPGRSDDFIDAVHLWAGKATLDADAVTALQRDLTCGRAHGTTTVCDPKAPKMLDGDYLVVTVKLAAAVPQKAPKGEAGRYSLHIDAGGAEATKVTVDPSKAPDLASAGANLTYEALLGVAGSGPVAINVADRRPKPVVHTAARIWFHENYVTWVVPMSEVGTQMHGVRVADVWGSAAKPADPLHNNADVVPGEQHAPYSFLTI